MTRPSGFRTNQRRRAVWFGVGLGLLVMPALVGVAIKQQRARSTRIRKIQAVREWPANTSLGPTARLRTVCRGGTDTNSGQLQYDLRIEPKASAVALLNPPAVPDTQASDPVPDTGPPDETEFQKLERRREAGLERMMRQMALSTVRHSTSNQFVIRFLDASGFKRMEIHVPPDSVEVTDAGLVANRTATTVPCGGFSLDYSSWTIHTEPYYGETAF